MSLVIGTNARARRRSGASPAVHAFSALTTTLRGHAAAQGLDHEGLSASEGADGGLLVNPDATLAGDAREPAREPGRLDGRRGRLEDAGEVGGRSAAPLDLVWVQPLKGGNTERLGTDDGALPATHLGGTRRGPQPAAAPELGVDPVLVAELPDEADRVFGLTGEPKRVVLPADLDQRGELRPP